MSTMTPTDAALKLSLSLPQPVDVKFWVFSKRIRVSLPDTGMVITRACEPIEVFGISSILKHTEYFEKMLSTGFSESADTTHFHSPFPLEQQKYTDDYDYESDSDLDADSDIDAEEDPPLACTTKEMSGCSRMVTKSEVDTEGKESIGPVEVGPRCRQVIIRDTAFLTWHALIYYLYTGKITFLDLRSADPVKRRASTRNLLCNLKNAGQAPACSPKSMYRLADKLGLASLKSQALNNIVARLLPRLILVESFSIFTSRYPQVMERELAYLCTNFHHLDVSSQWPTLLTKMLNGNYVHAGEALATLLHAKLTPRPPSSKLTTPIVEVKPLPKRRSGVYDI